ncbi:MAG: hypothetical protein AB2L17_17250 [Lentimicrobium sp.]
MKTKKHLARWLAVMLLLLFGVTEGYAQTQSLTQTVCIGQADYWVDPSPIPGATYTWSVSGGGSIVNGQGTTNIIIDWTVVGGPYFVTVFTTANGCPGPATDPVEVTVVEQPVGPTLLAMTPPSPVCDGTNVSATFNPGSGGVGCSDVFQYSFDGSGTWLPYTPGDLLNTTGHILVEIQGQRSGCTPDLGCSGTPWVTLATWTVNPILPVSVTIAASADPVCAGTSVTYTATVVNGGTTPTYEWRVNGGAVVSTTDSYTYAPAAGDVITCEVVSSEACADGPATGTFNPVVNPILPVSVTIAASADPVCAGTSVTYTATVVNGGTTPTYEWRVNGGAVVSTTDSYTYAPAAGDVITCEVLSSEVCADGPATGTFNPVVNPILPVSVTIVASADPVCAGTSVTYTATVVNGGTTPTYEWRVNGGAVVSTTDSYTYAPAAGDVITCEVVSSEACADGPATGTFNPVVNPILPVSVTIAASADPVCAGTSVTYTATVVNGGTTPTYEWRVNGGVVVSTTDSYTYAPAAGDVITCEVVSSEVCADGPATGTFNPVVNPILPVSVTIAASADPVCAGTSVTYTATVVNGGTTPTYEWRVNGGAVVSTTDSYTYAPVAGDVITCEVVSSEVCADGPATGTFNPVVNPIPTTSPIWHN